MPAFAYTIQYVSDVQKALSFYESVFDLKRGFVAESGDYGELVTGSTTLAFASVSLAQSNLPEGFTKADPSAQPFGIEIGFTTDDVERVYRRALEGGARSVAAPKAKPWGQVVAYVRDEEGFLIEICTPVE